MRSFCPSTVDPTSANARHAGIICGILAFGRGAISSVTWVPDLEDVVLEHTEAETQCDALLALGERPHV